MKKLVGGVITLVIGGMLFTVSKADIAKNFSKDTGLSQEESQQYVENISNDSLVSYDKVGSEFVSDGQQVLDSAREIDCNSYAYKWETSSLTCESGKLQLTTLGNDEIVLGNAYIKLSTKSASKDDMSLTVSYIDKLNSDYRMEIVSKILDPKSVDEARKTNSYNKALLQTALESK